MINYYEELSLAKESDIKHIQEELVRLESLWHKREVNSPEKANKMLGLIMNAQKVFASEISRKKYDSDLEASRREPEDPDVSRSKSLEKWTNQAKAFFNDGQYDLAKVAIDSALSYVGNSYNNEELFYLAARIYLENNEVQSSMEYVNRAIIFSPEWALYYVTKAQIFEKRAQFEQQYDKRLNDIDECRKSLMLAVSKAQASGDQKTEGVALGMLAFSLCFHPNADEIVAEKYAIQAQALGEVQNSKKALEGIARKREEEKKRKENEEKSQIEKKWEEKRPIYLEAIRYQQQDTIESLSRACSLFHGFPDGLWDVSERARNCNARIAELKRIEKESKEEFGRFERIEQEKLEARRNDEKPNNDIILIAVIVLVGLCVAFLLGS